jgi:hypothetical protein
MTIINTADYIKDRCEPLASTVIKILEPSLKDLVSIDDALERVSMLQNKCVRLIATSIVHRCDNAFLSMKEQKITVVGEESEYMEQIRFVLKTEMKRVAHMVNTT